MWAFKEIRNITVVIICSVSEKQYMQKRGLNEKKTRAN